MAGLLYREDMDEVRARLTAWWHGDDLGRPIMHIWAPRREPVLGLPAMPRPEGWVTNYSVSNFDYRVDLARQACNQTWYLGEAVPVVSPDLGPDCLALYLGCRGIDEVDTVWFEPCLGSREGARFDYDPANPYWQFTLRLADAMRAWGQGKYLLQFPDLIEGLDTLAAMRGNQQLLTDLMEDPAWVHSCLRAITDRYFHYYDILYDLMRDEVGGSNFWLWAPGRMAKLQCDFSAMISPGMFAEFMVPVLDEMCQRVSYSLYHWDGPGALPHLDHLLGIEHLDMIQWVPGAGHALPDDPQWWPLYHRMLEAGKRVFVHYCASIDRLHALRREFGQGLNRFLILMSAKDPAEAETLLRAAEG